VELSWPTFFLQIINFLVLVWILKRFLYKPVLEAVARRKAVIDKTMADAKAEEARARALVEQYQNRLADWEKEKENLHAGVAEEITAQRAKMMAALEHSLNQEREKARVLQERRLNELKNQAEEEGIANGVKFTGRLLASAACPELEARLVDLTLADLPRLPEEQIKALRSVGRQTEARVQVTSAFPLSAAQRSAIARRFREITEDNVAVEFNEDSRLLAGLRISVGPWVLRANVEDELEFFAQAVGHGSRKHG
jgi:F-type H+-transporting ATPase subunit b